jgi:hypothetical protein
MPPTIRTGAGRSVPAVFDQARLSPTSGTAQMIPSTCRENRLLRRTSTSVVSGSWMRLREIE